jgi:ATP-dependent Clp protease ATP-binding subunit ClpA
VAVPKVNVYLSDELAEAVRAANVPVSAVCQRALEQAVRRVTAIRETVLGRGASDESTGRLAHFTGRARDVLKLAVRQAIEEGSDSVGTEHLLGGLLAEGNNLAIQVLRAMEIEPHQVQAELERVRPQAPADPSGERERRFSSPAANALELTVTEAFGMGHNYIGCEHLLLGLIAEPDGAAGQALRALGAEHRLTRRAVTAALAGYVHLRAQTQGESQGPGPTPEQARLLSAAIQRELAPVLERLRRLEERLA